MSGHTITSLPFRARPIRELLDLSDLDRTTINADYDGYGWARVAALDLLDAAGATQTVEDVLLLALHTGDEPALDLEFVVPDADGQPTVLVVDAGAFLTPWLPRLAPQGGRVVLCMCNPHALPAPATPGHHLFWADGDVVARYAPARDRVGLFATRWHQRPSEAP